MKVNNFPLTIKEKKYIGFEILGITLALVILYIINSKNNILYHSVVEIASIFVALGIFTVAYSTKFKKSSFAIFLGSAYLFIGLFDLLHTFAYRGMGVFTQVYDQATLTDLSVQLWIIPRYMESISLFLALFLIKRKLNHITIFLTYLFITVCLLFITLGPNIFPSCFIEGKGLTPFKIYSEYLISLILLLAIYVLYLNRKYFSDFEVKLITASIILTIISEMMFTIYISVFDISMFSGHIFKVASFYLLYKVIIKSQLELPYHRLQDEIVHRKVVEMNLKESEEVLQNLYDKSPNMLLSIDISTNNIIKCNQTFINMTNYTQDEVVNLPIFNILHSNFIEKVKQEVFPQLIKTGKIKDVELQLQRKDGGLIDISFSGTAVRDKDGQIVEFITVWRDITIYKQAKMERMAREKAEAKNEAITVFLANMSHELRTPLNAIIGYSDIIITDTMEKQQIDECCKHIYKAGHHLLDIINDLLDISIVDINRFKLKLKPLNLQNVFTHCFELHRSFATEKSIEMVSELDEIKGLCINADRRILVQVTINILTNAIKYTHENGKVGIKASKKDNSIEICIWDNGIGIKKDHLREIFDQFTQVEQSYLRKGTGVGLGLALTKKQLELCGGKIWVESEPGKGSQFTFSIPMELRDLETEGKNSTDKISEINEEQIKKKRHYLIIEDDEASLILVISILENHGHKVSFAKSGIEGFNIAKKENPDIILLDIGLPDISGLEVNELLKNDDKTFHIPIIAMTAYALESNINTFIKAGFLGTITKPIEPQRFSKEVIEILNTHETNGSED